MRDRLSSWLPAFISLVVLFPPLRAADNARPLQVSFHQTGPEKVQTAPDGFIAGLDARDRFTARCSDVRTTAWDHPPEGVSHTRWVSLVMVGFRTRRNWLAFMFDGPNGGISLVVHRPACTVQPDGVRTFASPPGRQQFSENAVKELAADFAHAFPGVPENEPELNIGVEVKPWEDYEPATEATGQGPGLGGEISRDFQPEELAGVRVLAMAAAWQAGLRPTAGDAKGKLAIELAPRVQSYNIKASLKLPAGESTFQRLDVPADDLYPYLLRICRKLLSGDDVRDFKYIIRNSGQVLGLREEQVIYSDGKRLVARSILNDKVAWELEPPPRRNFQFATRAGPEGYRVFRHRYGLHRFEPGGETTELTAEGTEAPWAFEVAGEQAAIVNGSSVTLYEANEKMWTYRSPVALTAGPGFTGEHILVGTVTGQLLGLDKNSGKKQWENTLARTLDGPITNVAHMGLCAGGDGQLFAINPANGRMLWQHRLGDIPLRRPVLLASGALLVASMANTIELLDPETGNARAQYEFDTWLMGVEPLKTDDVEMVACSDLTGTVTFLNGSELKPIRQVRLQTRLQGRLFFAPALPPRWGSGKGMFYEEASSLLVSDTQGFVYMLAIPEDRP